MKTHYKTLRLILGDQLNAEHSWYRNKDNTVLYLIAELPEETQYVKHHCQKICAFFAAMKQFAEALAHAGHDVLYLTLDDTHPFSDLPSLLTHLIQKYSIEHFHYQQPDEYRLQQQLSALSLIKSVTIDTFDTEHFLLPFEEIKQQFIAGKHHKMEFFYRRMRQRFHLLMDGEKPLGGKWNYDGENRHKLKKEDVEHIPQPLLFSHNVSDILQRLEKHNVVHFGKAEEQLPWPCNRQQSLELLDFFCEHCLPLFGRFQDAMTANSPHRWSLYHSRLSFSLNSKMLSPAIVIRTAMDAFENSHGNISLPQIEGFIRQIVGWREYIRGVYWSNMPSYQQLNHLDAQATLPRYFWSGDTKMHCMQQSIGQSLEYAYAHHIQRLMVIGNFCLLTGIKPDEVDEWYLGVYIDAIEWVEMPNTRGMSQFADGGIIATKPYSASGNYINKMSDYCKPCHYHVSKKTEDDACPFNSLYWRFMLQHREMLSKNPRIGMLYKNWDKQEQSQQQAVLNRAQWCYDNIESL